MTLTQELVKSIKNANNIFIFTHVNPDGDTLGSAIAMKLFIEEFFGKNSRIVYTSTLPQIYSFVPRFEQIENISEVSKDEKCDLAIAVDIASFDRLAEAAELFKNADFKINIDHHKTNNGYGDLNIIDGNACSVGLILCKMFKEIGYKYSKDAAIALYTSIMTDTGAFKYENTSPECLRTAAELVEAGALPNEIYRLCYESKPVNMLKFQLYILNKAEFLKDGKIAIATVSKDDMGKFNATDDFTEGIVEVLRSAKSVDIAAILKETKDNFAKVSLRSKTVDLVPIIADFNGGGHTFAAGCTIKKPLSIAKDKLLERIENAIK